MVGALPPREARERARGARIEALRYRDQRLEEGARAREVSEELGVSRRSLSRWQRRLREDDLAVRTPGPRPRRSPPEARRAVRAFLIEAGPQVGLAPLKRSFPEITRRETHEILGGYREHYRRTHPFLEIRLRWSLPGAVWSMDHTLERGGGKVFSVKDLATGRQLLYQEVEDLGAERVIEELEGLFEREGRPLVVKSDQGSAFTAAETERDLRRREIFLLLSPARRPQYNGSIESRIRWLKCRTRFQTPGSGSAPSAAAMDRALALTNEHYSRQNKWPPIDESLRAAFARDVEETADEAAQKGLYTERAWPRVRRNIWRHAIESALEAHGILQAWRREIPLPKKFIFAARIC